jgi:hypothetical protein
MDANNHVEYDKRDEKRWMREMGTIMHVRYSGKRPFFTGDILVRHSWFQAALFPSGCESIHINREQVLSAARVRFKYEDGQPVAGAFITAYYRKQVPRKLGRRRVKLDALATDSNGVANFTILYPKLTKLKRRHDVLELDIANTRNQADAGTRWTMPSRISSRQQEMMLFEFKCREKVSLWDTEMTKEF